MSLNNRFTAEAILDGLDLWEVRLGQAYLFFRPWFQDRSVVLFSNSHSRGDALAEALATGTMPEAGYVGIDLSAPDLTNIPAGFGGLILGGVTAAEVAEAFQGRTVRGLKHEDAFPFRLSQCDGDEADLVVVGDLPWPTWPSIGLAMPTVNNAFGVTNAVPALLATYPGILHCSVVANGSNAAALYNLHLLSRALPDIVTVTQEPRNLGFAGGANVALNGLWCDQWYDFFAVAHDDIVPHFDALCQMVTSFGELEKLGKNPGAIGPKASHALPAQMVKFADQESAEALLREVDQYNRFHHSTATEFLRLGNFLILFSADALGAVGGFDTRFGVGNLEDDDYSLRLRLAGYTLWAADGAYTLHTGQVTFGALGVGSELNIARNHELFLEKWQSPSIEAAFTSDEVEGPTYLPLQRTPDLSPYVATINNEPVDLLHQATELELAAYISSRCGPRSSKLRTRLLALLSEAA